MQNLQTDLIELLKNEDNLVVDNQLNKNKIIEAALKVEPFLISLLIKSNTFKKHFFTEVENVISVATKIANEISTKFGDYRGTKSFYREPLRKYFKNKKLSFSVNTNTTAETGKPTMRNDIDQKYFVDLNKADWYAYNENFGSSEEKFLVKYFHDNIDDLKEKFKDIYLLRNERFFKLYRFSDAKATEPDFVLYMTDKNSDEEVIYQLFIEPKGDHLLYNDEWKEQFLQEIEKEAVIELYESQQYKLIGMPFYNKANREDVFVEKLNSL